MNKVLYATITFVLAAAAFFGGMKYQQIKTPARGNFQNNPQVRNQFRQNINGGAVRGEIINVGSSSATVKLPDGSTKIILMTDSTTINKAAQGSRSDIQTGNQAMIFGQTNSDGSISAVNIQLNPSSPLDRR